MNDQKLQIIIKYLDNQMSEEERVAFEKELRNDEVLAKEVAFQRGLHGFLERRQLALELDLDELGDEFILNPTEKKRNFPVWWAIPILLAIGTVLYFSFFNKNKTTTINDNSTEIEAPQQTIPSEIDENTSTPIEKSEEENTTPTESNPPRQIPIDQPIATVDKSAYERHPTMESIIQDTYRTNDVTSKTTVSSPQPDATFAFKENISFTVEGETSIQPSYRLIIYSNRAYDIENDYRLLDIPIFGKANNGKYDFRFNAEIPLKKGLYYLVIQKDDNREVLHISRFTIK